MSSHSWAADVVRPLRIAHVSMADSQVDEGSTSQEASWVILHWLGLKVVKTESGAETDVLTVPRDDRLAHSRADRWLTPDGKFFGVTSPGERVATVRRVADGATLVELDSVELLNVSQWSGDFSLASDATYLLANVRKPSRSSLVRIDFFPSPRVTASQDLGPLAHRMFATPDAGGIVVVVPSDDSGRAPAGRWLQVFDHQLQLQHKEKVNGPMGIVSAIDLPNPLIAIRSLAGDNGVRFRGESHWMLGELVRGSEDSARSSRPDLRPRFAAKEWILTGAFSPDGKWLVTSRDEALPALDIRSAATGELHRKLHLEGGRHELPGHQVISRIAFSKSGRYLCASDYSNAYLLDFSELIEPASSTSR